MLNTVEELREERHTHMKKIAQLERRLDNALFDHVLSHARRLHQIEDQLDNKNHSGGA